MGEFSKKNTIKNANGALSETFTNSAEQGVISQLDYFDHDITNDANISGYYVVQPDDFVYNPRISATAPCGPINRNRLNRAGVMSPLYTVFSVDASMDKTYLEHYFKTSRWHDFMFLEGNTGARSDRFSISDATFFEMPIWCPEISEQMAIAKQLETTDTLITLHQRKYDKLVILKKSMLEKMFPKDGEPVPEIRFAGFTDPWEQRKLVEVATFGGGHTPPMADPDNYEDGYVLWVTSQDVKSNYLDRTTTQITEKGAKELTLYPAGSLVMVTRSGILRHTLPVAELRKPSTVNQDIRVILPQGECCGEWLLQFFISHNKELLLEFGKTGTTVESVDFGKIKDMLLYMPSTVEQQQIGDFFAKLDSLITLHQRKLELLQNIKKSLLDKMFA
ncbi:restriction endonuclease subunit S [Bifidobacterium bifidum]|uniref:restriction endonuclease subunit S n=1 Tax=Bifidobacterium bifidum TaxID=1681 RepID=UPI0003966F44|nr:restriction endonuclease subunit S [Bifidobacterium bifidum]ERI83753.1 type I restriction modification DNA specificity domain protein [Bifidobacterium bifidum ATCC 29521 = JCM 1255 = DSM 20456]